MYGKSLLFSLCAVGLMATPLLAAPQAKLNGSNFAISEGVDDSVLSQIKADMGKVKEPSKLGFALSKVKDEDLAKLCQAYPDMYALNVTSSKDLTSLAPLAGLKKLEALGLDVGVADLSPLAGLTGVKTLKIVDKSVTDIAPLAKLVNVLKLDLNLESVADFSPLAGMTKLEAVDVKGKAMGPDLKWMSGMKQLRRFSVTGNSIGGPNEKKLVSIEGLPSLPNLKDATLSGAAPKDLSPLAAAFPSLTRLSLSYCAISDLAPLTKLAKLKDLSLYGAHVKDFSPLAGCPALEKVTYYATKGCDYSTLGKLAQVTELNGGLTALNDISWVAGLKNLKKFDVFAEQVKDYAPLASTGVERFQIWSMKVPQDLTSLGKVATLKNLKLWSLNDVSGEAALAGLTNLSTLTIDEVNVKSGNPVNLSFLGKLSGLKNLTVSKTKVTNFDAIAGCTALDTVDLRKADGVNMAVLKKLPALTRLTVTKGAFADADLQGFDPRVKIEQR
ncbi:MAG: hypothetical protein II132_01815 [Desulfovibrio sp.]|jgi:Leucine-rich repeat (LRR) protein|nr:hypothetical protein [Desulfovibrio sp.]MBQ1844671.1 hypothetical protein [Desulfovibrio sp.]MCR5170776.1 hypothetical protein [Desulfovibrio sp.]